MQILGKAEFLNPGGSVKDRVALEIVNEALSDGRLVPGGLVTEGTVGSTGTLHLHHIYIMALSDCSWRDYRKLPIFWTSKTPTTISTTYVNQRQQGATLSCSMCYVQCVLVLYINGYAR